MTSNDSLESLAAAAAAGDQQALSDLIRQIQHPIYRLSLRFLVNPSDAEDAAQEIMIRLITRLSTFEGRSEFMTWAYSVAMRMLIRTRKRIVESSVSGPERFIQFIDTGLSDRDFTADEVEYRLLCEEVRISCTYGMLLCLSRPLRAAYILGDVLGMAASDGAEICEISPAAFRQRLTRARRTIRQVIDGRCGLVNPQNSCHCARQIQASLDSGLVNRTHLPLANHPRIIDTETFQRVSHQIDELVMIADLYRSDAFAAPAQIWDDLQRAFPELVGER